MFLKGTPFARSDMAEICLRRCLLEFDLAVELNRDSLGGLLGLLLRYNPAVTHHAGFIAFMPLMTGFHTHQTQPNANNPGCIGSATLSRY